MIILHISNAAIVDKFYNIMYGSISELSGAKQLVYIPYKSRKIRQTQFTNTERTTYIYSPIKKTLHRILYHTKINTYLKDIENHINVFSSISIIHAHSLYSDGGLAYEIFKKYGTPYVVTVRSTDTEYFLKLMPWLKKYGKEILKNAKKVYFLNRSIKKEILKIVQLNNFQIIPNGLDEYWLKNINFKQNKPTKRLKLVQVGKLNKRKNPLLTIKAINKMLKHNIEISATFIGEGPQEKMLKKYINRHRLNEYVFLKGYLENKDDLIRYYREADVFVLPSLNETFGLVYIEAMSQGLPIICTINQGIHAFSDKFNFGATTNSNNVKSLILAINTIREHYIEYSLNATNYAQKFSWNAICNELLDDYNKTVEGKINE